MHHFKLFWGIGYGFILSLAERRILRAGCTESRFFGQVVWIKRAKSRIIRQQGKRKILSQEFTRKKGDNILEMLNRNYNGYSSTTYKGNTSTLQRAPETGLISRITPPRTTFSLQEIFCHPRLSHRAPSSHIESSWFRQTNQLVLTMVTTDILRMNVPPLLPSTLVPTSLPIQLLVTPPFPRPHPSPPIP